MIPHKFCSIGLQHVYPEANRTFITMNYPAAELRGIKMNFYPINPDAEHRGILLIKIFLMVV